MVNIRRVDIALLEAFAALYDERSVTRAARRLSLTQPTVSGMLNRLRDLFGDPLFVRTRRGVQPTPRAEALAAPIKALLADAEALIAPQAFDAEQSTATVAEAYDAAVAPAQMADVAAGGRPSVAVLPLYLLTPEDRYGALGDAVSQEVILELSKLHSLFVIARGSSFRFRESAIDLAAVGQVLGARYILSGTMAFSGRRSVVAVELAHAEDGRIVWADRFECPVEDLLQLRFTISDYIVTSVEAHIQMAEAAKAARLPTENLDAWSAYHRGLRHMYRFNQRDNEIAASLFDRAIAADPDFARGYAGLSFTHFQNALVGYTGDFTAEGELAKRYAERSVALDPLDPFVNLTMGRSEWIAGNLDESLNWFDRCLDLRPNFAFALYNRGVIDVLLDKGQRSEESVMKAIALSPIDPLKYAMLATRALSHIVRGEFEAAAEWGARAIRAPNAHVQIFVIAAMAHELAGNTEQARHCMAHVRRSSGELLKDAFLRTLSFKSENTRALAEATLTRLDAY